MQTVRATLTLAACVFCALPGAAALPAAAPHWQRIGGTGVAAGLAGPAGRPVREAWFSADGRRLYVELSGNSLWRSEDLGLTWSPAARDPNEPAATLGVTEFPDGAALPAIVRNPYRAAISYALGKHLYRSDDDGREWTNLTAFEGGSVIGKWQSILAISPLDPELIVIGNSMGLWKSYDAGITWSSLNSTLPNFPSARFVSVAPSGPPTVDTNSLGRLELIRTAGGSVWRTAPSPVAPSSALPVEERARVANPEPSMPPGYAASHRVWRDDEPISPDLTACETETGCAAHAISALKVNGQMWAATTNGRIWVSRDAGESWQLTWTDREGRPVTSLWADPERSATALAIVGGRVLRSTNAGASWFDIGSDLPDSDWSSLTADSALGTVYVGGPLGLYATRVDLTQPGPAGTWREITGDLPIGGVSDLALDTLRGRLYTALPGSGVFWMRVPEIGEALRALSAADLTLRPAAPGSLLTILGAEATRARAGGRAAPVLDAADGRTQLQVPFAVEGGSLRLHLDARDASHVLDMQLEDVSPAIFVVGGEALVLDSRTGALAGWDRPVTPGGSVLVMATGLGEVTPAWPAGMPSPQRDPPRAVAHIEARLDGVAAEVVSARLAPGYVGVYVVEVTIPVGAPAGRSQFSIVAAGRFSNRVELFIGH